MVMDRIGRDRRGDGGGNGSVGDDMLTGGASGDGDGKELLWNGRQEVGKMMTTPPLRGDGVSRTPVVGAVLINTGQLISVIIIYHTVRMFQIFRYCKDIAVPE